MSEATTNGYELLAEDPQPPPEAVPLLERLWDARRAEDWLLNAAFPDGRGAPGTHLTATGTDRAGRWAAYDGDRLRAEDCEWLRHITEVQSVRRAWWRTAWRRWPPGASPGPAPGEIRIALDCDPGDPVQMFQLYAHLGADGMPAGGPELRTFQAGADPGMPTDAGIAIESNTAVGEILDWLLWLLLDGRRAR